MKNMIQIDRPMRFHRNPFKSYYSMWFICSPFDSFQVQISFVVHACGSSAARHRILLFSNWNKSPRIITGGGRGHHRHRTVQFRLRFFSFRFVLIDVLTIEKLLKNVTLSGIGRKKRNNRRFSNCNKTNANDCGCVLNESIRDAIVSATQKQND